MSCMKCSGLGNRLVKNITSYLPKKKISSLKFYKDFRMQGTVLNQNENLDWNSYNPIGLFRHPTQQT